jgi:undecaprenyl-diphosphatase
MVPRCLRPARHRGIEDLAGGLEFADVSVPFSADRSLAESVSVVSLPMVLSILSRLDFHDRALFARWVLATSRSLARQRLWTLVTHLGCVWCSVPVALLPLFFEGRVSEAGEIATVVLVVSHLLVQLVKRTVGRRRPSHETGCAAMLADPDRFSFPSGHAAAAMSIAFAFSVTMPELTLALVPAAVLIGASRVMVGLHFPGDVLVGQLLALATGAVTVAFVVPL